MVQLDVFEYCLLFVYMVWLLLMLLMVSMAYKEGFAHLHNCTLKNEVITYQQSIFIKILISLSKGLWKILSVVPALTFVCLFFDFHVYMNFLCMVRLHSWMICGFSTITVI